MKKGGNANHPKKGDRIAVEPIRKINDIKAISKLALPPIFYRSLELPRA